MIIHNAYLSDEELELLMAETEADLVTAPPLIAETVSIFLQKEANAAGQQETFSVEDKTDKSIQYTAIKRRKKSEYTAYCLRVSFSVAASILMIFILSYWREYSIDIETAQSADVVMSKEMFLGMVQEENLTEEAIKEYEQMRECPSKEEVLNETNLLYKLIEENAVNKTDKTNQGKDNGGE